MQFSKRKTCQVSVFHMLIIFARVGERRKGLKMDWQKIGKKCEKWENFDVLDLYIC